MNHLRPSAACVWRALWGALGLGLALLPAGAQPPRFTTNPFLPPRATVHYARSRDYDARHLRLVLELDAVRHSGRGVVTHTLAPLRDSLESIILDAGDNLTIESCRVQGQERPFQRQKETLTITPAHPLPRGKEVAVEIRYTLPGDINAGGPNRRGGFHWILPDPEYPERRPGFWTQGETDTNHFWVPCYDYPNDFCTTETLITVPENWEVIGNGVLVSNKRDTSRRTRTFHWKMNQPHATYLLSLVGGELDVRKDSWAGIPLYYAVPKGQADLIEPSFGNTKEMLDFFSKTLGVKYPWPKYAQSAMFDFGGGMENISATTLGAGSLTDKRRGYYTMTSLNAHELAHQWFGDLVTCRHWGDIWLNEGFATFFEMLYMEHSRGKEAYDQGRANALRSYLREARIYKRPLSTRLYPNQNVLFDSHAYPKGGLILHMLRRELGDADFFRGLGDYLRSNAHQPVDSRDLCKALTDATGKNVEPFFAQWVYKPGHPVLATSWKMDTAGGAVLVKVKQTQEPSDGTPIYTLPLTIGFLRSTSSSAVERHPVLLEKAEQEFRLPVAAPPDAVLIDPDHDLLVEFAGDNRAESELPALLRYAPSHLDRVAAVSRLTRGKLDDAKISLLTDALAAENSDYVTTAILRALGELHKESLRPLLREYARSRQPEPRAAALRALGGLPPESADTALLRKAAISDTEPYRVVEAALQALATQDANAHQDIFRERLRLPSLRDTLASSTIDAMAGTKPELAAPFLLEALSPRYRFAVRRSAVRAIGRLRSDNAALQSALRDLLQRDELPSLQTAAINALRERNDRSSLPQLRALLQSTKSATVREAARRTVEALAERL